VRDETILECWYFVELRGAIQRLIDQEKTLEQIEQEVDLPFYQEWTGVPVRERTENIEHVYSELTAN
jgi:hypothetical protein